VPLPLPVAPETIVIQPSRLAAVQAHPAMAAIETDAFVRPAGTSWDRGVMVN
jgi:hypothetical protein